MISSQIATRTNDELRELDESEVLSVAGGMPILAVAAAAVALAGVFSAGEKVGASLGRALYNALH